MLKRSLSCLWIQNPPTCISQNKMITLINSLSELSPSEEGLMHWGWELADAIEEIVLVKDKVLQRLEVQKDQTFYSDKALVALLYREFS